MKCNICPEGEVDKLLEMGSQPVGHKFLPTLETTEIKCPLSLGICPQCGTVQLTDRFLEKDLEPIYSWVKYNEPEGHLNELTQVIKSLPGLKLNSAIAGLSFKDDSLLDRLRKEGFTEVQTINYPKANLGVETIQKILHPATAQDITSKQGKFDLILARHILEHVYNWQQFMETIRLLLNPGGYVVFEVPDSSPIFINYDYASIWEEHVTYFTETTFKNSLSFFQFSIHQSLTYSSLIENVLVAITQHDSSSDHQIKPHYPSSDQLSSEDKQVRNFTSQFLNHKQKIKSYFSKNSKRIALFGAGHIACSFINLFDLKEDLLCVIDDDPHKQNLYMPGSKLPIKNSTTITKDNLDKVIFALNPELENKIMLKFQDFIDEGGSFHSITPISKISILPLPSTQLSTYSSTLLETSEGVYQSTDEIFKLDATDMDFLKQNVDKTQKKRTRVCAHQKSDDQIHEMFITLNHQTYIRPHKHLSKSESFHIVEGSAEVVVFNDDGAIKDVIEMGDFSSGKKFFYRIDQSFYHTVLIKSDNLTLHEVTTGPFDKTKTIFAPWSPPEEENTLDFQKDLYSKVKSFKDNLTPKLTMAKHTLIIGGTKGTGLVLAKSLAENGHVVSIAGRTNPCLEDNNIHFWELDLENLEKIQSTIKEITSLSGLIDNLIFLQRYRGDSDKWQGEFNVSLTATKEIIEKTEWSDSESKSIVIVGSVASKFILEEQPLSYHISKAALDQLVKYYCVKLGPIGVRVNCVIPCTFIKPESKDYYLNNAEVQEIYKNIVPLGRMLMSEDITSLISFLCSPKSSILTGQQIILDGGITSVGHEALARKLWNLKK
jgi:cupin fold WbuC family metalloprotein